MEEKDIQEIISMIDDNLEYWKYVFRTSREQREEARGFISEYQRLREKFAAEGDNRMYEMYTHHGRPVVVKAGLRDKNKEHCLCWEPCRRFKPDQPDNCEIAQSTFENCVKYGIVTPVWECPRFDPYLEGEEAPEELLGKPTNTIENVIL